MKGDQAEPVGEGDKTDFTISVSDDLDVVFAKDTGIPLSAVITRIISNGEDSSRGDIITITRRSQ